MSITFYGQTGEGQHSTRLGLSYEHPAYLNFNNGNASAVLATLGLPFEDGFGECTISRAKKALLECKMWRSATASAHVREASDVKRPGRARVITGGLDEDGIRERIARFAEFIETMDRMGAERIYWA